MTLPTDWRDFWIQNPWAPPRVLIAKYGIKRHDIDNWRRNNPNVREVLNPERWRLRRDRPASSIHKIMEGAWQHYLEKELKIDRGSPEAVLQLIRVKTPKSPFQFLVDGRYLGRLAGYDAWIANGYTRVSFAVCNIWPGKAFADNRNLLPALFLQTKRAAVSRQDAIGLVKHIYLSLLNPPLESTDDVDDAKRRFVARHTEAGFLTSKVLREHGMSALHLNDHGVPHLLRAAAREFATDLGMETSSSSHWSARAFRKDNPDIDWRQCRYCGRHPVDLHHLLPRSEYRELANDPENVVPICVQVHAAITRNTLGNEFCRAYIKAQKAWLRACRGDRGGHFDEVMSLAHRKTIGFPTDSG